MKYQVWYENNLLNITDNVLFIYRFEEVKSTLDG